MRVGVTLQVKTEAPSTGRVWNNPGSFLWCASSYWSVPLDWHPGDPLEQVCGEQLDPLRGSLLREIRALLVFLIAGITPGYH